MKNYAVTGSIMLNNIKYADGSTKEGLLGGGGLYALSGIRLWTDQCHFVGDIGEDFETLVAPWWDGNHIPRTGLNLCHRHCVYNQVNYEPDGRFFEHSIYPEGSAHNMYMVTHPEQIEPVAGDLKGLSMVASANPVEFRKIGRMREKYGFKVMFEINTGNCKAEFLDDILECLQHVDIYSVNLPEAKDIFSQETEEGCIAAMQKIGKPCFFRVGIKGSYMVMPDKAWFVPIVRGEHDIDPTGCGNSSTAAAFYAMCEGEDPLMCAIIGNVTSCLNAQQFGPMPVMDAALRQKARRMAEDLYRQYSGQ